MVPCEGSTGIAGSVSSLLGATDPSLKGSFKEPLKEPLVMIGEPLAVVDPLGVEPLNEPLAFEDPLVIEPLVVVRFE